MSKHYSIRGHRYGERGITEICQCGSNPQEIVAAIKAQRISIGFTPKGAPIRISKFDLVHIVENDASPSFAQSRAEKPPDNCRHIERDQTHGKSTDLGDQQRRLEPCSRRE
jgi:hypothetical protein